MRLSGGAANVSSSLSLGGAMSLAADGVILDNVENNLWDDVSGVEATVGDTEYRGIYIRNAHPTLTWESAVVWIEENTPSEDTVVEIGLAPEMAGVPMSAVATEQFAPSGVVFTAPATKAAGLPLGDLAPGSFRGVWVRRRVFDHAQPFRDVVVIRAEGDTAS